MFRIKIPERGNRAFWDTVIVVAALLVALTAVRAFAVDPPESRKMSRQLAVMEEIIDQVLLDSPNFLVFGRENTSGLYVKDVGMIFTFRASLVGKDMEEIRKWSWPFEVKTEDGKTVIVIPDEESESDTVDEEAGEEESGRSWKERRLSRHDRLYRRGKTELVDVLLDYGDTLTTLKDGQWVVIVARLVESDYFKENKMSHLILKAKIGDLRSFTGEKISEKQMVERIVEEEY